MKKIITFIATLTLITVGAESAIDVIIRLDQKVEDILNVDLKKDFFTEKLIEKALDGVIETVNDYKDVSFNISYYKVRYVSFDEKFGGRNAFERDIYMSLRALVIAKAKDLLHRQDGGDANQLLHLYNEYKDTIRAKFEQLTPEKKEVLAAFLREARATFTKIKEENQTQDSTEEFEDVEQKTMVLLRENASAEVIAEQIRTKKLFQKKQKPELENTIDPMLLQFVLRRKHEGGSQLLNKYVELINAFLTDFTGE